MNAADREISVAIVGAGFSGVMTAANLVRLWSAAPTPGSPPPPSRRITLIDRAEPARGPAYATTDPNHLLNVPAARMSAWPNNPQDFVNWCAAHNAGIAPNQFAPRPLFAKYLASILADASEAARHSGTRLEIIRAEAVGLSGSHDRFSLTLAGTHPDRPTPTEIRCHALALCTGNMEPAPTGDPGAAGPIIANPWTPGALDAVQPRHSVAIIGSGLTMLDVLWSLESRGHAGAVTIISRHALMPRPHRADPLDGPPIPVGSLASPDTASPRRALRWVRERIARIEQAAHAAPSPLPAWSYVIESLRPHTQAAWGSWSPRERRQFMRHLRALWDVHRHCVSPRVLTVVERLRAAGRLNTLAASVTRTEPHADSATVHLQPGRRTHELGRSPDSITADRVVVCTGPNPDLRRTSDPLLASLVRSGLLVPDRLGLGALCENARAVALRSPSSELASLPPIHLVGPLRRADLWESIAVPELRVQAAETARLIAQDLLK